MMDIKAGGVFCANGFGNKMQCDSPALVTTALNQWVSLAPDPLGRDFMVLKASVAERDYSYAPSDRSKRAELQIISTVNGWGEDQTYHWRIVIPKDWVNFGPSSYAVIAQLHDVNAPGIGRRPSVAFEIIDNVLYCNMSNTANPNGVAVCSMPVEAGMDFSITVHAHWADGINESAAAGIFRVYFNGLLRYEGNGIKNTWDNGSPSEPNPPYLKCGIYQPNSTDSWWIGRRLTSYVVAAFVVSGFIEPNACMSYVESVVSNNSRRAVYHVTN